MDEHTLAVLEFDKIKQRLKGLCQSPLGQEEIGQLFPLSDLPRIQKGLDQIQQMKEIFLYQGGFPSVGVEDLREVLERISPEGTSLEAAELLALAEILACVREVLKFHSTSKGKSPLIEELTGQLKFPQQIYDAIHKSVEPNGDIKDTASPQLGRIRRQKVELRQDLTGRLHSILRSLKTKPEEEIVTLRQGRFVISVPESELSKVNGIIQDRSGTGLTFFVEPVAVVEFNNKLKSLELEEKNEIHRILLSLTTQVRQHLPELQTNLRIIGILDSLAAKARLALDLKCNSPILNRSGYLRLRNARHPFLDQQAVVPLSLEVGKEFCTLVITGPNTGGKTVALKCVGLLTLMTLAGLQIPAEGDSQVTVLEGLYADIGDEQSIEMSLSTFSAHVKHIVSAVESSDENSLVLLDEIGAGTDPQEGSALGEAILQYLTARNVKTIVTTHLGALKVLAQNNPKIENGSFEFDSKSLRPTYQFRIGLPGSSYAVEIASRLGLKPEIVAKASSLIGSQEKDLTTLLAQLDSELKQARQERGILSKKSEETEKLLNLYTEKIQKLEKEQKEIKGKALLEAKELLSKSRVQIEHLIRELKETKAEKVSIKKALGYVEQKTREVEEEVKDYKPVRLMPIERIKAGDRVWVDTLKAEGEVVTLPDKSGKLKVLVGGLSVSLTKNDIYQTQSQERPKSGRTKYSTSETSVSPEISIRGLTVDEALEKVDRYLDQALLAGLSEVSIIHGKGTGTLRKRVTQFLKEHPRVEQTRLAEWDQGGMGVTIVRLKK
ncbi:MAG: hypothetical protein A2Z27_02300 [candidate division Zixibacteria bacterium RBG_16_50_21]|nr:MAG: hypothetical protein A2Z27_02300 [candidate division Zixibacteria bacterium RBG_16_50_21]